MGRPRKGTVPSHLVVVDSSTLWHEDKENVVDPRVDSFFHDYRRQFDIQLVVPEVVRGEILYQQTSQAIRYLENANEAFIRLSAIADKKYQHKVHEEHIRRAVSERFDRWLSSVGGDIAPTPVSDIDWSSVINSAIWRKSCFSSADKKEKGFRDAMILETLVNRCYQDRRGEQIAFLCKDKVLRENADLRLRKDERFSSYELIVHFKSYLDLTREKLEDAFIKNIMRRATKKFFTPGKEESLYYRDGIKQRLKNEYQKFFDDPQESDTQKGFLGAILGGSGGLDQPWEPLETGKFWIGAAQFLEIDDSGQYIWTSPVTFVRHYARRETTNKLLIGNLTLADQERILVLPFQIIWRAKVSRDARFRTCEFINDKLEGNIFRAPTEEERQTWGLNVNSN